MVSRDHNIFLMKNKTVGTIIIRIGFLWYSHPSPPPTNVLKMPPSGVREGVGGGSIVFETSTAAASPGPKGQRRTVCELRKVVAINNSSREINF